MAISVTSPFTCRSWSFDPLLPPSSSSSTFSNLSNFSSLKSLPRLTLTNRPFQSKPRTLHLVQAKEQPFSFLDELLEKAEKPVLVYFYATWSGPSQLMARTLDEVSITMADTIQWVKIDAEKYPEIADKYSIEDLPTYILFKDGKPFDRFEGTAYASQVVERIKKTLRELRQLDLWSKYRFTCCCSRCIAVSLTSIDQSLQEISASNGRLSDVGIKSLIECIDDAIDDYISSNNAESCCKKLENTLLNGFKYERLIIRLHSQNHLSLNCYTTLASAYKVRSMDENRLYALNMNRFSAAYSLILAVLTHHLFLSESSLIKSVSYFWIGAGEAVLNLARSLVSNSGLDFQRCKCSRCGLIDIFEANFDDGYCPNKILNISNEFLNCISDITRKVWKFLVNGNGYLEVVKDRWLEENIKFVGNNNGCDLEGIMEGEEIDELFGLSGHCLLYGGILSNISDGNDSHLSRYVRQLVYDEEES